MNFTLGGNICHFGSPIFTTHVFPKALLTNLVELKTAHFAGPNLKENPVSFSQEDANTCIRYLVCLAE